MGKIILFTILYLVIPPGIFVLAKFAKDRVKYALFGRRKSATAIRAEAVKEGLNQKIMKRIQFTIRDPRTKPIPFKLISILMYVFGMLIAMFGGYSENWRLLSISIFVAYATLIFSIITANKIVVEREQVLKRMLELKGSRMRFVNRDKGSVPTVNSEFKVTEWGEDLTHPEKMYLYMPTDFDILEVDNFMESFNLVFGGNGQWIADDTDEKYGGFDFNAGVAAIRVSPRLPQIAMWHERYLNPEYIHWSYFPLALGSENGVPIYNEEEDIYERVIGFAVNSGQEKLSKKNGVNIGNEITAAPQILIAGGTGGGKSLDSNTKITTLSCDE